MKNEENLAYFLHEAKTIKPRELGKKLRVAFLASSTINGFEETMRVKCFQKGIDCITYVADYNQYNQEILNQDSELYNFKPDITFLILDTRHILGEHFFSWHTVPHDDRPKIIDTKINEINQLCNTFNSNFDSKLVVTSLQIPNYSPYGINDESILVSLKKVIYQINTELFQYQKKFGKIFTYDFNEFVRKFGDNNIFSYKQFFSGDIKISTEYIPKFVNELMGYVYAITGITKKCIVLDLDNTLWGGIIGEDGFDNIKLGDSPVGHSFVEFQKRLLALNQRGIILAINSKNNFDDAIEVIKKHPNMIIKEDNFACVKINWDDKVVNLQKIAEELNIGLDSMVFFDDDPINQEYVRESLPEVLVVDLPKDSSQYAQIITEMKEFDVLKITEEDTKRSDMYLGQKKRKELENKVDDFNEFLKQMNIEVSVQKANNFSIPRISQLTLKTNQFNLTTRRYQEEEISKFSSSEDRIVECVQVNDKFGDNGITGTYIIEKKNNEEWIIDTFLLSCRIMGRGVEEMMMNEIIEKARVSGIKRIKGEFIPTAKNKPAENFYEELGFKKENGFWVFDTGNIMKKPEHIKVIKNE
ncbi:MAG: HAD-IIIC family phosphatase [Candidatus Nitrosopelagicus sp.]|nr:HAD-IIIC family phosphatase [Candidatus Nitrosopelagicus sp.]